MAVEERAVLDKQMITSMIDTLANNGAKALGEMFIRVKLKKCSISMKL
ncbi:hypothetical protein [Neobacillus drentensis]